MSKVSILVINGGSSSLKFGLYTDENDEEQPLLDGLADGIGRADGKLELRDANGRVLSAEHCSLSSQAEAFDRAAPLLKQFSSGEPSAVGHRVVHGGPRLAAHQLITPPVLLELSDCVHFAPLHIPMVLQLIKQAERLYPNIPQFACFDTAFHRTIPERAGRFAIPRELFDEGIRRYGFHGLSYESIVYQLGDRLPNRTVIAHLGNGASLAAVENGMSVDTTMGLTPVSGIPMATRSGDLDPGVLVYLQRTKHLTAESIEEMLNNKSGLAALSGGKADMRELEKAADTGDHEAELAIEIFCMSIRKVIAAYFIVLGGLDMLVFTGGIGEHSARIRANVCRGLQVLGMSIENASNDRNASTISARDSRIRVCMVSSQEDRQIARHCRAMMRL
jgi:acetate kinase